jgi:hypothetical protein
MTHELEIALNLPFPEAEKFIQDKLNIPTARWDDLWHEQHAKGFMVAGAAKADILTDFRTAVEKAIKNGTTLEEFRKDFDNIVKKHGWSYNGTRNWRSEVIYSTNVRQAYNAGRWQQLTDPEQLEVMPYLTYRHGDSLHPRPAHLAWDGITLPAEDAWWDTHFPQNGWGCKCRVSGAAKKEYEAARQGGKGEAPDSPIDPKTGEPAGIDRGFGYNVGDAYVKHTHDILAGKLANWPADIGAEAMPEMAVPARKLIEENYLAFLDKAFAGKKPERAYALLGAMTQEDLSFLKGKGQTPQSVEIAISDRLIVGKKAARHTAAGDALTESEWRNLPAGVLEPEAVLYDRTDGKLLYVASAEKDPTAMKVVVESNVYVQKLNKTINEAVSVFKMDRQALQDKRRYELVRGQI